MRHVRSDMYPPSLVKTFTLGVAESATLHTLSGGALRAHLPASIMLLITVAGTFDFTDELGTANSVTFPVGTFVLPFTVASYVVGSTAVGQMVVAWASSPQ